MVDVYINKAKVDEAYKKYKKAILYMSCDLSIKCLCLPTVIENILISNGFHRVYDLIEADLSIIRNFGVKRRAILIDKLSEFFPVDFQEFSVCK